MIRSACLVTCSRSRKRNFFILLPWTLTRDLDLEPHQERLKRNQRAKYLDRKSFYLKFTAQTMNIQTHRYTWQTVLPGSLKWIIRPITSDHKAPPTPATMSKQHFECYKLNNSFEKVGTNWTCSICSDFAERTKFHQKNSFNIVGKTATMSKQRSTLSRQHSFLSKESFDL